MNLEIIQTESGLSALEQNWNPLLQRSRADTIFLTWEWISSWWECYAQAADRLHVITVRDHAGDLIGVLPFFQRKLRQFFLRRLKTLRLIGDGSVDSDYLDLIIAHGQEDAVFDAVWRFLRDQKRTWDVLELAGVPETSPTVGWLERLVQQEGFLVRKETLPCAVSSLPDSWDEYLASLKPRFRTKVRSVLRKLDEGQDFRFYTVETEHELKVGLQTLFDLHGRRWKTKGGEGVFLRPEKRRFYESFAPRFLKRGWLAFDFLELDGKVAACQLCFRYAGTQFLLQEGFDPELSPDSVGIALRALVFRKAISDGIKAYDFLAGLGRHKTQWQVSVKNSENISVGPRTVPNMVHLKLPVYLEIARERVKAVVPDKVLEIRRRMLESRV
jgi:CelD/BcsL family acetyltransferase involved in cellulose biosynthesis